MVDWGYFNQYEEITDKYLPSRGEGDTMATQIVTAVCKLVYKFYNDGDVYDNTYYMYGWGNDLSSYANWLAKYTGAGKALEEIFNCHTEDEYTEILAALATELLDEAYLEDMNTKAAAGSIYDCDGDYRFEDYDDNDDDDDYYDGDYYDDDEDDAEYDEEEIW